jgi:hypothetical protein
MVGLVIPLATTTIAIERPGDVGADALDPPAAVPDVVAAGVRAHFPGPSGAETRGDQSTVRRLLVDPCDLTHVDTVVDESTGLRYGVVWAVARAGDPIEDELGGGESLAHVVAEVTRLDGSEGGE